MFQNVPWYLIIGALLFVILPIFKYIENVCTSNHEYSTSSFLYKIFSHYVWIGIVMILIAIAFDNSITSENKTLYLTICIDLIQSIGISILVASIFSFAATSADFTNRIKHFLEDIIIRRNFLSNIEPEGKKEALKSLIKPSDKELNNLPNINDYYDHFINNILSVNRKNVISNYSIHTKVFIDTKDNKIKAKGIYSYRLYPSSNGYTPIRIGFDEDKDTGSKCNYIRIYNQKGEQKIYNSENIALEDIQEEGNTHKRQEGKIDLKNEDIAKDQKYLDIELEVLEVGFNDHLLLEFKALQPTNGFKFVLECDNNLSIKDHSVFVVNAKYYETLNDSKRTIHIVCNQWINEGSGVCISILKE